MALALKDLSNAGLAAVLAANLLVFGMLAGVGSPDLAGGHLGGLWPAGLGVLITGILNGQVSAGLKARIVFLRIRDALPGCRAFTEHAEADHRVDVTKLEERFGSLPVEPEAQNRLWYKMYRTVDDDPRVAQAHRSYLFARDYSCCSLLLTAVLGGAGFGLLPEGAALYYLGFLVLQFLLASQAARIAGRSMVVNVLASISAQS